MKILHVYSFFIFSQRKFDEKHLGQIKTVYPSGFTFRQEKGLRGVDGLPVSSQLTIDANFEDVIATLKQGKNQISPSVLVTRRNVFESKLADIIKKHHQVCSICHNTLTKRSRTLIYLHYQIKLIQNWTIFIRNVILTLVLSEWHQILFHRILNEDCQCHSDSTRVPIILTLF